MSTFVRSITGIPKTGLVYVDGLLWGSRWRIENDSRKLTYSFVNDQTWDDNFNAAEQTAFHNAIKSWGNVANFSLEFSGNNDHNAEITFHSVRGNVIGGAGTLGMAMPPGNNMRPFVQGDVMINWEAYSSNPSSALIPGGFYYYTYAHEIGHALGLAHPHDKGGTSSIYPGVNPQYPFTSTGTFGLNQFVWTIMSYVTENSSYSPGAATNWGYIGSPMAFDIAAIQYLYGANTTYNTGNNTYTLPTANGSGTYWSCIWDAGGIDTISGQTATGSVVINLNNASLANNDPNAGGYISQVNGIKGGYTIANARGGMCVVENATGSSYNDTLNGNPYNNTLYGGYGADKLYGGSGNDTLDGGTPTAYDSSNDTLYGEAGNDSLLSGNGLDYLDGGDGADTLNGWGGNDKLYGGYGADKLYGGLGNDSLDGGTTTAYDTSNDTLYGEAGNDFLLGGNGLDYLNGGDGADTLNAWKGNDSLIGGGGNDSLVGSTGNDTLTGGAGADRFTFNTRTEGIDRITDFVVVDDTINVSATGFGGGLIANTVLSSAQFIIGTASTTVSQRFIYNSTNGGLFFDQDGVGSSFPQLQIATVNSGLAMTNNDISVIA